MLTTALATLRSLLFSISPDEASFSRRGFDCPSAAARARLQRVGETFIAGYNAAIAVNDIHALEERLERIHCEWRGFAYEGAAMALALRDVLTPWHRDRFEAFLRGPGDRHAYMAHIGAGWALARLKRSFENAMARHDPLLRWLLLDGFGFHEGYFHTDRTMDGSTAPATLQGYARRAFDQGLGRCIWFVAGAEVVRTRTLVDRFKSDRHRDLWAGIGLAVAYAGGVGEGAIRNLTTAAGEFQPEFALGVAFAAKARDRAGNPVDHTEQACQTVWQRSAEAAAGITDEMLVDLPPDNEVPSFEVWRQRIQDRWKKNQE